MTAGRKTTKPAKKAKKAAKGPAKKQTPIQAPPKVKVPKRGKMPPEDFDHHAELLPGDPDERLVAIAEKGREAAEVDELVAQLSEKFIEAYGRLSQREIAFVKAYVELRSAAPAAVKAGYSKSYAASFAGRLLNKPAIRAIINEVNRVNFSALCVDAMWIQQRLVEEAQFAFEGTTRVKALVALGDIHQIFPAKRIKHSLEHPIVEGLREAMELHDGAGTGLPPPEKPTDGRRAH